MTAIAKVPAPSKSSNVRLWIAQSVLAVVFLLAGTMKLVTPAGQLTAQAHISGEFLHFIGACETLGALGLILPGIFHIHRELTALAAAGLVIIMTGAVPISVGTMGAASAVLPFVLGALALYVAHGRWAWVAERRSIAAATVTARVAR